MNSIGQFPKLNITFVFIDDIVNSLFLSNSLSHLSIVILKSLLKRNNNIFTMFLCASSGKGKTKEPDLKH